MSDIIQDMELFVAVALRKSFSLASKSLDIPISTLSRKIARLEKDLGIALFTRNSRRVELTDVGKQYFSRCELIIAEAKSAQEALKQSVCTPSGNLSVSLPPDFLWCLSSELLDFTNLYPNITMEIKFNHEWFDLIAEPIDIELRVGEQPVRSPFIARRVGSLETALYATPEFLEKHFYPNSPKELKKLPLLSIAKKESWILMNGEEQEELDHRSSHSLGSMSLILDFTVAGKGVGILARSLGDSLVKKGSLIQVLPQWKFPLINVYAVRVNRQIPAKVQLFIDFLIKKVFKE